jgi:hypothetical protein
MWLATALASASVGVRAQGPSPITITNCTLMQYVATPTYPWWRPFGPDVQGLSFTDGIRIAYINRGPEVATRVAFLVNYRGDIERIVDVGTFSPGVTIDHRFGQFEGDVWLGPKPNYCRPVAVRFVNGSFWRAAPR